MNDNFLAPFIAFITLLQGANLINVGFKIFGILTIVLYDIWSIVSFQELRKLNYNYQDEQNYLLFALAYLQLLIGGILFLYAIFLL